MSGMFVWARTVLPDLKTQVAGWSTKQVKQKKKSMLAVPVAALPRIPFLCSVVRPGAQTRVRGYLPVIGLFDLAPKWSHKVLLSPDSSDLWLAHSLPCRDSSLVAGVLAGGRPLALD